jgi:cob(I)alamin adenosyltransferase
MKIYTRTGDKGETALFAGGRISKGHARLQAYGTVDELNTILGLVLAAGVDDGLRQALERVQSELFTVGADLATPLTARSKAIERVTADLTKQLEREIDNWDESLPTLKNFILPGGSLAGAFLHQARTVCRRAERWVVVVQEAEPVNQEALRYLNRLSDWLFVIARVANDRTGYAELVWQPSDRDVG